MKQIHNKKYADTYRALNKSITGIGVNFDADKRRIDGWIEEEL
jgi:hypothetical protein